MVKRDPVSAVFKLTSFARDKEIPEYFRNEFKSIKDEQRNIKPDELEKWKELYQKSLVLSENLNRLTREMIAECSAPSGKIKKTDFTKLINEVKSTIPMLEKGTKNAVSYVRTSRLERQKPEVLRNIKNSIDEKYINTTVESGIMYARFDSDWKVKIMDFVKETLEIWQKELLTGLSARVKKEWDVYQPAFSEALLKLSFPPIPDFEVKSSEDTAIINFPNEKEEKLITFWGAVAKIMRSTIGLIMMTMAIAVPLLSKYIQTTTNDTRVYLMLFFVPVIFIYALILAKKECERNLYDSEKKITTQLFREMERTFDDAVNEKYRSIRGDIDRFVAENERVWSGWVLQINKGIDCVSKSSATSGSSSVKIPSRLKYMAEDLENKIIPELEERIRELEEETV